MISLIFDTETTGFPLWKEKPDHPGQPGIVELAFELYWHEKSTVIQSLSCIVDSRIPIPAEVTAIHGISNLTVMEFGIPLMDALNLFLRAISKADRLVAHNLNFDKKMIEISLAQAGLECPQLDTIDNFCTMFATTPMLKLPGNYGHKWPTLEEAYRALVDDSEFEGAHRAGFDCAACREIMLAIEK